MRKKRMISLLAAVVTAASLLAGCGSSSATAGGLGETAGSGSQRKKITALLKGSETSESNMIYGKAIKDFCQQKGLDCEIELVPTDADYITKLQLYINSNSLPDIYGCANGSLSAAAQEIDAMVNIGEELKKIGKYDSMNQAIIDFLTDAKDGQMYLMPNALYAEYFAYRKDTFGQYGLEVPKTWDEFLNVCKVLKDNGEIPLIVGGKENWQLMRYLSFAPWRVTHDGFITGYISGEDSFEKNEAAKAGAGLLYTLGTEGYFQPGFLSTDNTANGELFYGGTGAMMYSGSGDIAKADELYGNGQLGFFPVPDVDGMENMETNVPLHAGFAYAFNKQTYDDVMEEFFQYLCNEFTGLCYEQAKVFSPFNDPVPDSAGAIMKEVYPFFENAKQSWVSWDDKLDSATLTKLVDLQQLLVQGQITPDEYCATADTYVTK
ncbi:Maltose-binding periplasmic proteins/domains [uncultured Clostridium sp.]|nr:Maltose-binding periplasmic proteins/domains [uncultured Clostridium sp.]